VVLTEAAWLGTPDPQEMLVHLGEGADSRKLRLFACGCVRQVWQWEDDPVSLRAVPAAERFADGLLDRAELDSVLVRAWGQGCAALRAPGWETVRATLAAVLTGPPPGTWSRAAAVARRAATFLLGLRSEDDEDSPRPWPSRGPEWKTVTKRQADLLREIFGHPFRRLRVDPAWLEANDGCVVRLARGLHVGRDFEALPILADALEEAGCEQADILGHLRSGGPHALGCWALDPFLARGEGHPYGSSSGLTHTSVTLPRSMATSSSFSR
jgi:hypothetical protein